MSYSFTARAATKAELQSAAEAEFDKVVAQQPIHAADRAAALTNIETAAALVPEKDGFDFALSANGWVQSDGEQLTGASISASVTLVRAEV